jgi:DNA adenine methylase
MQKYITRNNTFVYLDPPYRPITKSSAFTAYTKSGFNDNSQRQLKLFCDKIDEKNSYFMLSNSDPKNTDVTDSFFDDLYEDYIILRVKAKRNINSDGEGRGKINEILVKNYE